MIPKNWGCDLPTVFDRAERVLLARFLATADEPKWCSEQEPFSGDFLFGIPAAGFRHPEEEDPRSERPYDVRLYERTLRATHGVLATPDAASVWQNVRDELNQHWLQ